MMVLYLDVLVLGLEGGIDYYVKVCEILLVVVWMLVWIVKIDDVLDCWLLYLVFGLISFVVVMFLIF